MDSWDIFCLTKTEKQLIIKWCKRENRIRDPFLFGCNYKTSNTLKTKTENTVSTLDLIRGFNHIFIGNVGLNDYTIGSFAYKTHDKHPVLASLTSNYNQLSIYLSLKKGENRLRIYYSLKYFFPINIKYIRFCRQNLFWMNFHVFWHQL